ncbi:MAG TPA: hypothetical protein VG148_19625 [Pyrinomonadaceae bacterium]|nr:hypothetical protein [Pyrinomonadaceae bacterium]
MNRLLLIGLVLAGASAVAGRAGRAAVVCRAVCDMTSAEARAVHGIRLGMTPQQVLALFPGSAEDGEVRSALSKPPSPLGVSSFSIRPDKYASKEQFAGVSRVQLTLLDGRILGVNFSYNGPEWKHVDEFITQFSGAAGLPPPDAWEPYVGMDTQLKTLRCKDFEVSVFAGGEGGSLNYVLVEDTGARQKLKERREKARGKREAESRP